MVITPIDIKGQDERGYTAEYIHAREGKQLIVHRKAGSVSGRHYHKGLSATKNPEIFILLNGSCTINWYHVDDKELHTKELNAPVQLEIAPLEWHEVIAITDCTFLELNSIAEHQADTFYIDQ
ncbi:MAG: hypothetical protein R2800_14230 [Flavipsychrobacter sp.]